MVEVDDRVVVLLVEKGVVEGEEIVVEEVARLFGLLRSSPWFFCQ